MYFQDADKHKEECVLLADKDGVVLSINSQFRKNFDYDVTDIVGQSFIMLFHPISIEVIINDLVLTLSNTLSLDLFTKLMAGYLPSSEKC
jgi:PAS domain-containing protein